MLRETPGDFSARSTQQIPEIPRDSLQFLYGNIRIGGKSHIVGQPQQWRQRRLRVKQCAGDGQDVLLSRMGVASHPELQPFDRPQSELRCARIAVTRDGVEFAAENAVHSRMLT